MIIHGGVNINYDVLYDDVAVLDTTQSQFTWSVKETKGAVPLARYSHTATMVGTNMLIAFGMYYFIYKIFFSCTCIHMIFMIYFSKYV